MSATPKLPDVNQLQEHMQYFIAYLVVHNKPSLLKIIRENGITLNNPSDSDIITSVFVGIRNSAHFRKDLKDLMTRTAVAELNLGNSGRTTNFVGSVSNERNINDFVKGGAVIKPGFGSSWANLFGADDYEASQSGDGNTPHGWYGDQPDYEETLPVPNPSNNYVPPVIEQPSKTKTKKPFAETGLGSFLSNLFTKENVEKAAGVGIDLLGQKLSSKANIQEANAATQLQLAQTEKYKAQIAAEQNRNKWLLPVLIIGALTVVAVVIVVVSKNKKSPSPAA